MKISKLFHWIYALLMLLPFAFFVPSIFYYAFNDNATMQTVEVPKSKTIAVDFNQYVKNTDGTYYSNGVTFQVEDDTIHAFGTSTSGTFFRLSSIDKDNSHHKFVLRTNGLDFGSLNTYFICAVNSGGGRIDASYTTSDSYFTAPGNYSVERVWLWIEPNETVDFYCSANLFDLTQMFGAGNEPTLAQFNTYFPDSYYSYTESELMQITYDTGETEQLVENTGIINYAWESIWDLPLFNWSKVTFVSVPFAYITGLFGIGANSTLNYAFGYFATISICWLVFDIIMYVPMLVHRWIDKARIE